MPKIIPLENWKLKQQWNATEHLSEWPKSTTPNADKGMYQ